MYNYLYENGECYYIKYNNSLVGDVSLYDINEISIVISKEKMPKSNLYKGDLKKD